MSQTKSADYEVDAPNTTPSRRLGFGIAHILLMMGLILKKIDIGVDFNI